MNRWRSSLSSSRYEQDLDAEIQHHLEERIADLVASGVKPRDAEGQARREFGPVPLVKDACRDEDRVLWFDEFTRNARFALRRFSRRPGLATTIVATLGLCVAANLLIFTFVDSVLFRTLPYPDASRLFQIHWTTSEQPDLPRESFDGKMWFSLSPQTEGLQASIYSAQVQEVNFVAPAARSEEQAVARLIGRQRVGSGFFEVLGVPLAKGRGFRSEEDVPGGPALAVISWNLWQEAFEADSRVIGRSLDLAGEPHTVIGVTAEDFEAGSTAAVWTPLRPSTEGEGGGFNYRVLARIATNATTESSVAQLEPAGQIVAAEYGYEGIRFRLVSLLEARTAWIRSRLLTLWAAVGLVLLIGCVNIAGLLLANADTRQQELVTRRALGGGRATLTRQVLTECLMLGIAGCAFGLLLTVAGLRWASSYAASTVGLWHSLELDARSLFYVVALAVVTTAGFGALPALAMSHRPAAKNRTATRSSWRGRNFLVAAQVTLGVSLLLTATLLVRNLFELRDQDPGIGLEGVLAATVSLNDARFEMPQAVAAYVERGLERLRQRPEFSAAGVTLTLPFQRGLNMPFRHHSTERSLITTVIYVTPETLELFDLKRVSGRSILPRDTDTSPPVVVVNQSFLEEYSAQGIGLEEAIELDGKRRAIVGVVGNVRQVPSFGSSAPLASHVPTVYMPLAQMSGELLTLAHTWFQPSWVVKTRAEPTKAAETLRAELSSADPLTPVAKISDLATVRQRALSLERFQAVLFSSLAFLAAVLAALGLTAIAAASVAERRKELAIRLALGATLGNAIGRATMPVLVVVGAGLLGGLALAQLAGRAVRHMLHGVSPADPTAHLWVVMGLLLLTLCACLVPAMRLVRLPVTSVLHEDT